MPKKSLKSKDSRQGCPAANSSRLSEAFGILTLASALLIGPSLATVHFGNGRLMGPLGEAVGRGLNWMLGAGSYLVVIALLAMAVKIFAGGLGYAGSSRDDAVSWRDRLGFALALLFLAVLLHLIFRPHRLARASVGGQLGEFVGEVLCAYISTTGTWIVTIAALLLSLVLTTPFSLARVIIAVGRQLQQVASAVRQAVSQAGQRWRDLTQYFARQLAELGEPRVEADGAAAMPRVVRVGEPGACSSAGALVDESTLPADLEIGRSAAAGPVDRQVDADLEQARKFAAASTDAASGATGDESSSDDRNDAKGKPEQLTIVHAEFAAGRTQAAEEGDAEASMEEELGFVLHGETYRRPPMSLLSQHGMQRNEIDREAIYEQAERLSKTLADYKIFGKVTKVHPGPVVTMYEFVPAPGTRISKVAILANDLAMSLEAQRVRIVAPIPGKGAIGIEVPNPTRETVSFKEIVVDDAFRSQQSQLTLALGKNIFGAPVTMDLARMPHLLVAGATGAGKSVSINAMICSLLLKYTPQEVRMIMVDPKFLELSGYNDIPHLLLPVVTDPKKANIALRWAVAEMERRYQLLAEMRVRDIASYNRKVTQDADVDAAASDRAAVAESAPAQVTVVRKHSDGTEEQLAAGAVQTSDIEADAEVEEEQLSNAATGGSDTGGPAANPSGLHPLPYIVVVIDEFADLMMVASKEVETSVARLAQKARAAGIHLLLATQRPSVDVITGLIKANFPSRMAFQVASSHDSKTILGTQGAENLLGSGDMLVLDRGADMKRIHGAYISDAEIQRVVEWLRQQGRPLYDMDILKAPDTEEEPGEEPEERDEMYDRAVAIVAQEQAVSISMIQRRLRIGYNRSARIVEKMEREGVVGPADGVRGREVLISEHS